MQAKAGRLKTDHNVGMLVIDCLLPRQDHPQSDMAASESRGMFSSLKTMAKELNIPVVVLSRLSSNLESRDNKRPQLSDLDEFGGIEENADMICFIHRDQLSNSSADNPRRDSAELIIGKHKNGPIGTIELAFLSECATFENLICT